MTIEETIKESVKEAIAPLTNDINRLNRKIESMLKMMTVKEVSEYFDVTEQSIWNWVRRSADKNPLPVRYVGGNPRFNLAEIDEWSMREASKKQLKLVG